MRLSRFWPRQDRGLAVPRRRIRPQVSEVESRVLLSRVVGVPAAEIREVAPGPRESTGNIPLTELTGSYRGFPGGLYDEGRNDPPPQLAAAAGDAGRRVVPRDKAGQPSATGEIGLVAIGPSVARLQFAAFQAIATRSAGMAPAIRLVDGGQDGVMAENWSRSALPWAELQSRVARTGLSRWQVQVAWISPAHHFPARYGPFPQHAERFAEMMREIVQTARRAFPNLALIYLSSQPYYGYMLRGVHPEPYSYEGAFAVRQVILDQRIDDPFGPEPAADRSLVLLWGPYLWADGERFRADGLTWQREDYRADGVHPSASGRAKAAQLLWSFFTTDVTARPWFVGGRGLSGAGRPGAVE